MTSAPLWRYRQRADDAGHSVITLGGEIDVNAAVALRHLLQQAVRDGSTVTVDVAEVGFIDSTVIGALVTAHNAAAAAGRSFVLVGAHARVRRVLRMTGVLETPTPDTG